MGKYYMAVKRKQKTEKRILESPFKDYWDKNNYIIFGVGLAVLLLGFYLMAQAPWDNPVSLSISPIVLLIAYLVIFPLAIFYRKKQKSEQDRE
jgi:cytochrome bd-type quinol oxidase subunit 2